MKIVEYKKEYAAQVADMWNKSGDNWGNDDSVKSPEDVISREDNSGNLKLYIAVDNEEVVGYCSFSEYQYDEGASYLPLLNVRPDYHGKKVGKALILKVIEDAIKAEWPRFDLFTWSGNIKAMPLYKKCGFFWERNNRSVHLMNFLPYVYKTEALDEYLSLIDWYKDSKRVIDMKQDGDVRNGFDYYRYDWNNDKTSLSLEFEKTGRGLRLIETPDYLVEVSIPKNELVYENEYEVKFRFVNKTSKDLEIKYVGKNNKTVKSTFENILNIENEVEVTEKFFVGETKKTQDKMKTYPVVETDLYINGKKATFKLGLEPKSPVSVNLQITEYNHTLENVYTGYLDVENNLDEKTEFTFDLPKSVIDVQNEIKVLLNPKEKRSLKVEYKVLEFGFYNKEIKISYNGKNTSKQVETIVKGFKDSFTALTNYNAYVVNGNYTAIYSKSEHRLAYINRYDERPSCAFFTPQIGLPFSLEFSNLEPEITFPTSTKMAIKYSSKAFKGIDLINHVENMGGILKVSYELINNADKKTLAVNIPIWHALRDVHIPYNGMFLRTRQSENGSFASVNSEKIDENWLYSNHTKSGLTWHKDEEVSVTGWRLSAIKKGIVLSKGDSYETNDFYVSYVHPDAESFRKFSGNFKEKDIMEFVDYNVNGGNPFTKDNVKIKLVNNKKVALEGTVSCDDAAVELKEDLLVTPGLKTVKLDTKSEVIITKRQTFETKGNIKLTEDKDSMIVDNGLLKFKVSSMYSDSVYSLVFNNQEWLDSNYPEPKERSWWGTFIGGINQRVGGIQDETVQLERRTAEFISLKDNFGNEWQGVKTVVYGEKDKDIKGLDVESYYVTLPGVPVLHSFANIVNNTGKLMRNRNFYRYNTFDIKSKGTTTFEQDGVKYKCGNVGIERSLKKLVVLETEVDYNLALYNKETELLADTQSAFTIVFSEQSKTVADKESKQLSGDFIIFTKDDMKKEYLKDLENIKFDL